MKRSKKRINTMTWMCEVMVWKIIMNSTIMVYEE